MGKFYDLCPVVACRGRPDSPVRADGFKGGESGCTKKPYEIILNDFLAKGSNDFGRTHNLNYVNDVSRFNVACHAHSGHQ